MAELSNSDGRMGKGASTEPKPNFKLDALKAELAHINPEVTPEIYSCIEREIMRLSQESILRGPPPNEEYIVLNEKSKIKLLHKILVPVDYYPGFNFIGKILANKGENLKKIATETKTRLAILGQGSAKKYTNVQQLLDSGDPEHIHLLEPLHVRVESFGLVEQVWSNMSKAMEALKPFMVPDETYEPPPKAAFGFGKFDSYGFSGRGGRSRGRGEGGRGSFRGGPRGGRGASFGGYGGEFDGENSHAMTMGAYDNGFSGFGEGYTQGPSGYGRSRPHRGMGEPPWGRGMSGGDSMSRGWGGPRGRPY
jgi:hypothetical protein